MKKSLRLFAAFSFALLIGLAGCGSSNKNDPRDSVTLRDTIAQYDTAHSTSFYVSAAALAKTYDGSMKLPATVQEQIYGWYCAEDWATLETYFTTNGINKVDSACYPPAYGGFHTHTIPLKKGMLFDRYQQSFVGLTGTDPVLRGTFTSPMENGKSYAYADRALKVAEKDNALYYTIEVLQDLTFTGEEAEVIPWFGCCGKGKQVMFNTPTNPATNYPFTWNEMAEKGWVKVTIVSSPSGQYSKYAGLVL